MRLYMSTVVPSTGVTGHPDTDPNNADRVRSGLHMCRWFGGRILAFHAVGPGSIPGRRRLYFRTSAL